MDLRKLTILHSNDMHGDFLAEELDDKLVGGLSMLSGYLRKVRSEEKNCLYVVSGDMLQGSIIDSEFMGVSTIDLMNLLHPDVATLGNHEIDYGFGHLMFLDRCAKFPIINANLFVRNMDVRLFNSHIILNVNGIQVLFIGILTEEILNLTDKDPILGTFVDIHEAAREVEFIVNNYRHLDIDFTVLLTHIGFEEDKALAELLHPDLGVDLIIGGHSHTYLDKPAEVNNILITQAGVGTDHIGRFDITVNMDTNSIHDYEWQLVPINNSHCPRDPVMEAVLNGYLLRTQEKYDRLLTDLPHALEHGDRYRETALGNAVADALKYAFGVDLFILGSGSIRSEAIGPLVTLGDLKTFFPYDDQAICLTLPGKTLREMLQNFFQIYSAGQTKEYYQFSRHTKVIYHKTDGMIEELLINDQPIAMEEIYTVGMQSYHIKNMKANFGIDVKNLEKSYPDRILATSCQDIIREHLQTNNFMGKVEGRIKEI